MHRNIYIGENYSRKVVTPLITTDCNAYKIIWDSKVSKGIFKITARRADDTTVFDYGELNEDGTATYIMKSDMYSKEGPLTLYLAICDNEATVTCREILFNVQDGGKASEIADEVTTPINKLTQQIVKNNAELNERITNLIQFREEKVYVLSEESDILVNDGVVTGFVNTNYSEHEAIAFPDGVVEIAIPEKTEFIANKVIMPKSLMKIADNSFSKIATDNVKIEIGELVLNEGLTEIGKACFRATTIGKITMPESLKTIGMTAFAGVTGLKEITFPENVEQIGTNVCAASSVEKIVFRNNNTEIGSVGTNDSVLYGFEGSTAEAYAIEKGRTFVKLCGDSTARIVEAGNIVHAYPNVFYDISAEGRIDVLIQSSNSNKLDEYMFSFETPEDISEFSLVVTADDVIKWVKEPILKPNYIYEVSVVNGVGVIAGTAKEVA